ncbi:hypothetical protein, partial [Cardiobacterium hominis]|uniref:hypothetical protein n=1 Tax=Cardiobacterium hominis TaxID=2718 RepID=UPI0028D11E7C
PRSIRLTAILGSFFVLYAQMLQSGKDILKQAPDFIKIIDHIPILFLPVAFVGDIGFAAFFLNSHAHFI